MDGLDTDFKGLFVSAFSVVCFYTNFSSATQQLYDILCYFSVCQPDWCWDERESDGNLVLVALSFLTEVKHCSKRASVV